MSDPPPSNDRNEKTDADEQIVRHLQAAAREVIGAARSFLDLVEKAVDDPFGTVSHMRPGGYPRPTNSATEHIEVTEEPSAD